MTLIAKFAILSAYAFEKGINYTFSIANEDYDEIIWYLDDSMVQKDSKFFKEKDQYRQKTCRANE